MIAYADIDVFTASLHAGRLPAGAARDAARVVANALDAVYQSAAEDLYSPSGAKNCRTVQELLDSYRPAVRAAARAMLATVPPAVKRVVARLKRTYKKASSAVVAAAALLAAVHDEVKDPEIVRALQARVFQAYSRHIVETQT